MRVLVAGGAGFIGSWAVEALLDAGCEIVIYDNLESGRAENLSAVVADVEMIEADIRDFDRVMAINGRVDAIVHLAFPTPLCTRDPRKQFYDTASGGTANLLELALDREARFLYGSSISVYGHQETLPITETSPVSPLLVYGVNKLLGEQLCSAFSQVYGLRYCALRISDTYGPRDRRINAINNFLGAARECRAINIAGSGEQRRSYTYVTDIAHAIVKVVLQPSTNDVFNVTTCEATSINNLARMIQEEFAPEIEITRDMSARDSRDYIFANGKLTARIGAMDWTFLKDGLAATYAAGI
jgi:nucleoside-diphosphate-sugar epimerase